MFSTDKTKLSKDAIANRMFRNAARFWGLNDTNIDNFDPLVRLLLEACAVEIYRIDNEVAALQRTMTERLAGLLIPEVHTQPRPAHAICHARSTDEYQYIALETQFLHQKRIASVANGPLDTTMDVFFSPAGRFKAIDGDVKVMATGGNIYRIDALQTKETFLRCMSNRSFPAGEVWVGIEASPGVDLTDISFYFDLAGVQDRSRYLSMLRHLRCECNDREIILNRGLSHTSFEDHKLKFENSLEELYLNRRLEKQVNRIYSTQFLTLSIDNSFLKDPDASWFMRYPKAFEACLQPSDLAQMEDNLIWFKLKFPPEYTTELTENLTIGINCFPVVNRHINELSYRLNAYFNIIPLLSSEQFLAVKAVEGTVTGPGGRNDYIFYPFDQYNDADKGIYTVRDGDLERFDSRNAAEYLNYLVELLRDESRSFAAFGQDFMASAIKELNQNIGLIDQKIRQNLHLLQTAPTYLLVNPVEESDTIFVKYWTSNGAAANAIRANTTLDLYVGSAFKRNSIILMSATSGGMDKLENTETLKAFKSVLLSRGRIVTSADIKSFCAAFLQANASEIRVERGVGLSPMPNQGLMPVVRVSIKPGPGANNDTDWERLKMDLTAELEHASAPDMNYLVELK